MGDVTKLSLLGPVLVERAGREVRGFESRKALALLGYLAVRAQPASRTHLADLFWPDLPEARGRANLSGALHNLNTLVPGCITADRNTVAHRPSPTIWIDTDAFGTLTASGTPDDWAAAVDLYRDDLMTDLYPDDCPDFEIWLVHQREEWRAQVADVLQALVRHHTGKGEDRQAIPFLRRLVTLEPWCEEAHRELMVILARGGQRSAALAQFDACRRLLADELGVEPAAETVALVERLRGGGLGTQDAAAPETVWLPQERLMVVRADRVEGAWASGSADALAATVRETGRVAVLTAAQLAAVARQPAVDLQSYRLGRIAEWSQPRHRLDRRFVALTLLVDQGEEAQERWRARERRYDDLAALLADLPEPAVALLGPPGSGKTTLLRRLELDTAVAGLRDERPAVSFLVTLSRYGSIGAGGPLPDPLAWLCALWQARHPALPGLDGLLAQGQVLLLLDGLNEMPHASYADYRERVALWKTFVAEAIAAHSGNRAVIACRSLDYSAPLSTPQLRVPQVRIEPLADAQIRQYLVAYSPRRAERIWNGLQATAQLDLMRTPYLLKLLIDQVRSSGEIARGRAAVITGFVRAALKREVERENPLFQSEELLTRHDYRRVVQARRWQSAHELPEHGRLFHRLAALAYGMQVGSASGEGAQVRAGYAEALALLADRRAEEILEAGEALGILEEDPDRDEVAFGHQLLQEYFAAREMARQPDFERMRTPWRSAEFHPRDRELIETLPPVDALPALPTTGWEETAALAAAMAGDAEAFVRSLMDANLALAGRCANLPELRERLGEGFVDELRWALVGRSRDSGADLRARIAAGLELGWLGDPRFERRLGPHGAYLMSPLVEIPGGEHPIGEDAPIWNEENNQWNTTHIPRHSVTIAPFQLGRFLVTNAEWDLFLRAGGYEDEQWWDTQAARAWRLGEDTALDSRTGARAALANLRQTPALLDDWRANGKIDDTLYDRWQRRLAMSEAELETHLADLYPDRRLTEPRYWRDPAYNNPAQPVIGICWYEARAYCLWLAAQSGRCIRLPSEVEWEAAARGTEGAVYAFGDVFDAASANTWATHLKRPSPIGVLVGGDTPAGLADMTGNVWEWTSSLGTVAGPLHGYPYRPNDGREAPAAPSDQLRVARGGSWRDTSGRVRCAYRLSLTARRQVVTNGMRVAVGLAVAGS